MEPSFPRRRESSKPTPKKNGSPTEALGDDKLFSRDSAALSQLLDAPSPSFPRRRESSVSDLLDPAFARVTTLSSMPGNSSPSTSASFTRSKRTSTELRKAILQLAVMGKLVPQNPKDQPASELLKEIEAEKKRLVKEGKLKTQKPYQRLRQRKCRMSCPKGGSGCGLGDIIC